MAFRLADLVLGGSLYHSGPHRIHGRIYLRGRESPIMIELTGAPSKDLVGRNFEFEVEANDRPPTDEDRERAAQVKNQQIGPTGEMTAARLVKSCDCPPGEMYLRSKMGEPLPTRWERCLYLEWFSQNGRVLIELANPKLHFLDGRDAPSVAHAPELGAGGSIVPAPEWDLADDDDNDDDDDGADAIPDFPPTDVDLTDDEDPGYGLIPEELTRELEDSARQTDQKIGQSEGVSKMIEEFELLENLMEKGGPEIPIRELLDGIEVPSSDADLTEEEAEQAVKVVLAQLALAGIAFEICEHLSMREAYRILMEKVCDDTMFPQMSATSYVDHFSTSDYCKKCQEEFGDPAADDIPF